jgi:26S proteasome regulatory subunit N10
MPLEATMMIIDNSEYMRNGDYVPTRFDAQADAVNTVFQTKIDSNPENTVGVMSMAGKGWVLLLNFIYNAYYLCVFFILLVYRPEVLVTHSKEIGHILQAIHTTSSKIGGAIDIPTSINIASLALKHRENKNLRQRIIVFVGSPLDGPAADEKNMIKLAKKLKKNNVAVDIVCYGDGIEEEGPEQKSVLKSFVENVSSSDNSHLLVVPPGGGHLLSDALIASPILAADRNASIPSELVPGAEGAAGGAGAGSSGAANDFEFGVDPSLDPELAMALRLSMQEAQARQQAEESKTTAESSTGAAPSSGAGSSSSDATAAAAATTTTSAAESADDDDEELQRAIAMSQQEDVDMEADDSEDTAMDEDEDEDAAIQRAIEMSMKGNDEQEGEGKGK